MNFQEFIDQAWNDHPTQSQEVAARMNEGIPLITEASQIPPLAQLITHVFGEHLGRWEDGMAALQKLKQLPCFEANGESGQAIHRSIASLELASKKRAGIDDFSTSDQIRILAVAASALSEQKDAPTAQAFFRMALEKAQDNLPKEDPAHRALAVTGNNLACALEEKPSRSPVETELMILAAKCGRKFWEIAGTWLQVERAEYRLSQTYRKAGDLVRALEHAQVCLEIAQENNAPALELFFGYEALALAEKARGNAIGFAKALEQTRAQFGMLGAGDKSWCEPTLRKLE
jgi:tetratricopeptide (TPR) repeat protein